LLRHAVLCPMDSSSPPGRARPSASVGVAEAASSALGRFGSLAAGDAGPRGRGNVGIREWSGLEDVVIEVGPEKTLAVAAEAFLFGYPLVLMDLTCGC
jgi:hypothetical protein